jgi:hypothetical protein
VIFPRDDELHLPEAASKWPTFDFTEPRKRGFRAVRSSPNTLCNAVASIGSPTFVPVPCASTYPVSLGSMPAFL